MEESHTKTADGGGAATLGKDRVKKLRSEFPILERTTYLNSCSLGALSKRSEAYLDRFLGEWHELGASAWYEIWLGRLADLRERVARFLGAPDGSVALEASTSAALARVASAVEYDARPKVVTTELDFPTLAYQWMSRPEVEVVVLESPDGVGIREEQFAEAVDERTAFLATSHVFFATGFVQDVEALASVARAAGAYSLIDGYHGAGQVPVGLGGSGVDFYTAGPLKWLCGGPGLAYLFVRPELHQELRPRSTGWFAAANAFDFDIRRFEPHTDARRFEMGTPALATVHTALGGQEILSEVGIEALVDRNRALVARLIESCRAAGLELTVAREEKRRSAVVMVRHDDPAGAVAHLAEEGIVVDHRPGHVRVSPHFYNTEGEVDRFVEALAGYRA